jgi:hypothetical protein
LIWLIRANFSSAAENGTYLFSRFPCLEKFHRLDSSLFQNRSQSPFRHVSRMVRNRGKTPRLRIEPDLMTASGVSIENEPETSEPFDDVPISEAG